MLKTCGLVLMARDTGHIQLTLCGKDLLLLPLPPYSTTQQGQEALWQF